jgi:hypothetical protein
VCPEHSSPVETGKAFRSSHVSVVQTLVYRPVMSGRKKNIGKKRKMKEWKNEI